MGDTTFNVTGAIPSLVQDASIDLVFVLEVQGVLDSIEPAGFIAALTKDVNNSGYQLATGNGFP